MNQLLCPEWVSELQSANFSTVHERESRPQWQFSVCCRFANHERITARTWITSSQFSVWVAEVPLPASMLAAELNWTEKGTNQFLKWFRSLRSLKRFVRFNDKFATDTTLSPKQEPALIVHFKESALRAISFVTDTSLCSSPLLDSLCEAAVCVCVCVCVYVVCV